MISDTLSDAVAEIDRYLGDDTFGYEGPIRDRIRRVRDGMDRLREELDTPPTAAADGAG